MKKHIITYAVLALMLLPGFVSAQSKRYPIVFYNVENLFDTIRDPSIYDEEFTPGGAKNWNGAKYWKKIANIEEVFSRIAAETRVWPAVIGVSEIENRNVLEDIVAAPRLGKVNYQIAHFDSPDARGVDVALFYRPDVFRYEGSEAVRTVVADLPDFRTRDILMVWGTIDGEKFYFLVNHWPSRSGGQTASAPKRFGAALTVRSTVDSVLRVVPDAHMIIMGDLNDDPSDPSIAEALGAGADAQKVGPHELFNPYAQMHRRGFGTLAYQGAWNLFDNMIVNGNLLEGGGYRLYKGDNRYYGFIYDRPFLRTRSGQYKDYPFRTFSGNDFMNGYSDHFPVYIYIAK